MIHYRCSNVYITVDGYLCLKCVHSLGTQKGGKLYEVLGEYQCVSFSFISYTFFFFSFYSLLMYVATVDE